MEAIAGCVIDVVVGQSLVCDGHTTDVVECSTCRSCTQQSHTSRSGREVTPATIRTVLDRYEARQSGATSRIEHRQFHELQGSWLGDVVRIQPSEGGQFYRSLPDTRSIRRTDEQSARVGRIPQLPSLVGVIGLVVYESRSIAQTTRKGVTRTSRNMVVAATNTWTRHLSASPATHGQFTISIPAGPILEEGDHVLGVGNGLAERQEWSLRRNGRNASEGRAIQRSETIGITGVGEELTQLGSDLLSSGIRQVQAIISSKDGVHIPVLGEKACDVQSLSQTSDLGKLSAPPRIGVVTKLDRTSRGIVVRLGSLHGVEQDYLGTDSM
ncbi:hypothetical protein [Pseudomonas phage vB_PaeP_YL1]